MKKTYKISIPHLKYTVIHGIAPDEFSGRYARSQMITENTDRDTATIFFKTKPSLESMPTVAHEVVHVLQFICRNRNITMEDETEHMGYLMQYILASIYGYKLV